MKKIYFLIPVLAFLMSCNKQVDASHEFTTKNITQADSTKVALVELTVDYPQDDSMLSNAVREFINERLGGTYCGPLSNGDELLSYYVKEKLKWLEGMTGEAGELPPHGMQLYEHLYIKLLEETEKYVTYTVGINDYFGGAHGSHTFYGATFRKTDGRRFGQDMLRPQENYDRISEWHRLIKTGVRSYFKEQNNTLTDEQLKGILIGVDNVNMIPNPQYEPYLTKEGLNFVYQEYEIAPYAAGQPRFTMTYEQVLPYLTATALALTE